MTGQVVTAADVMRECVSLCVSVICHSCLHSLESCLSEWSPCEGLQQLMMLWCLNSEMWLWSWVSLFRTVWSEGGFRRSCSGHGSSGHGSTGLSCSHIYSYFSRNTCGKEFCNTKISPCRCRPCSNWSHYLMHSPTENCLFWNRHAANPRDQEFCVKIDNG